MESHQTADLIVVAYYLSRIKSFLEGDEQSQVFLNIPKEIKFRLINIVYGFPRISGYCDDLKEVANDVWSVLENNKGVYTLSYEIISGAKGEDVLLYRKEYASDSNIHRQLRQPCETTEPDKVKDCRITTSFKLRVLNATVKFVKDDTQLRLVYPDMAADQGQFVMDMLTQGQLTKMESTDVGFGYKSLYGPLWEAMKLFSLKYQYRFQYVEPNHPEMKRVVFQKIPKESQSKVGEALADDTTTTSILNSMTELNLTGKPLVKLRPIRTESKKSDATENNLDSTTNNLNAIAKNSSHLITSMEKMTLDINKTSATLTKNNVTSPRNKVTSTRNNVTSTRNNVTSTRNNVTSSRIKETSPRNNVTSTENNVTSPRSNVTSTENNVTSPRNEVTSTRNNVTSTVNNATKTSNNATSSTNLFTSSTTNRTISNTKSSQGAAKNNQTPTANNTYVEPNTKTSTNVKEPIIMTDKARKLIKFMRDLNLEDTFIHDSLMKIREFLSDESMASIIFPKLDANQRDFLIQVNAMSKNTGCYMLFSSECQKFLDDIRYYHLFKVKYTIRDVAQSKKSKNGLKNIMFVKLPTMPDKKSVQPTSQNKQEVLPTEEDEEPVQPKTENKHQIPIEKKETVVQRLPNKELMLPTSKKPLQPTAQNKQTVQPTSKIVKSVTEPKKSFKEKLKESLEQPVQSEKATQMMLNMGWSGGALGLRGEGITEPIKMELDFQNRAGLGHVMPQKVEKVPKNFNPKEGKANLPYNNIGRAKKQEMYVIILNGILKLVSTDVSEVTLKFSMALNVKICNFITQCETIFNKRKYMELPQGIQRDLATEICDVLLKKVNINISAYLISDDTVELRKSKNAPQKIYKPKQHSPTSLKRLLLMEIFEFYQTEETERRVVLSVNEKVVKLVHRVMEKLHNKDDMGSKDLMLFVEAIRKRLVESHTKVLVAFNPPGELLLMKTIISDSNNNKVATASKKL